MKTRKVSTAAIVAITLALIWFFLSVYPFYFMIITSLKTNAEFMNGNTFGLPEEVFFGNYQTVLTGRFPLYLRNSLIVTGISVALTLTLASLAAYVFARLTSRTVSRAQAIVIACMSVPIHVSFIPVFILTRQLGIYDTIWSLIPPYVAFDLPVSCFILTGFMKTISREIEEAAQIDGASIFLTYLKIVFPLSTPALVTLGIYTGIHFWNEFSFALILTQRPENRTLPLAVWDYKAEYTSNLTAIITVLALSTLPMIIAFVFGQDKLVKGMMAGAVKG